MKKYLTYIFAGCLMASCSGDNKKIECSGMWLEPVPGMENQFQGVEILPDGKAKSVNMNTLLYKTWKLSGDRIILEGESIGNGVSSAFTDTLRIISRNDSACTLVSGNRYLVKEKDIVLFPDKPSRPAEEGFEWEQVSGSGIKFWAQTNGNISVVTDPVLPGARIMRDGSTSTPVIRVFNLPNKDINDVLNILKNESGWSDEEQCAFKEVKSERAGVKRYTLSPTGKAAEELKERGKNEPICETCAGWGMWNSGIRYFEIHSTHPDKAIFMEIGQDAPLFDEKSIVITDDCNSYPLTTKTLKGTITYAHEVRSFVAEGDTTEYWLVDKTGELGNLYKKAGEPSMTMKAEIEVADIGRIDDGFAAEYDGAYQLVRIINTLQAK